LEQQYFLIKKHVALGNVAKPTQCPILFSLKDNDPLYAFLMPIPEIYLKFGS
jgi:hypothetical protein